MGGLKRGRLFVGRSVGLCDGSSPSLSHASVNDKALASFSVTLLLAAVEMGDVAADEETDGGRGGSMVRCFYGCGWLFGCQ